MAQRRSGYRRSTNDLYRTPPAPIDALARCFPDQIKGAKLWDPAAGLGDLAKVLRDHGAEVAESDKNDYGRGADVWLIDFLKKEAFFESYTEWGIVMNPPFGPQGRLAERFIQAALMRPRPFVAALLGFGFDAAKGRKGLFGQNPRYRGKIALTERITWLGMEDDGKADPSGHHAWFIWGNGAYETKRCWYD